MKRLKLLLSNDDGINGEGLKALAYKLCEKHDVTVVAPVLNMTASSHAITIGKEITIKKVEFGKGIKAYAVAGTPADCVKFALAYLELDVDLVLSGINKGHNIGTDLLYSGTVSAALEGVFMGKPAIAFSAESEENNNFPLCASYVPMLIEKLYPTLKKGEAYNVNIPDNREIIGVKTTKIGSHRYDEKYTSSKEDIFVLSGDPIEGQENDIDCDVELIKKGYITVTPIKYDFTDYEKLENIKELF